MGSELDSQFSGRWTKCMSSLGICYPHLTGFPKSPSLLMVGPQNQGKDHPIWLSALTLLDCAGRSTEAFQPLCPCWAT